MRKIKSYIHHYDSPNQFRVYLIVKIFCNENFDNCYSIDFEPKSLISNNGILLELNKIKKYFQTEESYVNYVKLQYLVENQFNAIVKIVQSENIFLPTIDIYSNGNFNTTFFNQIVVWKKKAQYE